MVLVKSREGIYAACANAQMAMQKYQIEQGIASVCLSGAQERASDNADKEVRGLISDVKKEGAQMQLAIGIGAALTIIGSTLGGMAMNGRLSEGAFRACAWGGNMATTAAGVGEQLVTGLCNAKQQRAKGEVEVDQAGSRVISQYTEDSGKDLQEEAKDIQGLQQSIASYIQGQTSASRWN
jgi:hypothetical protein